MRRRARDGWCNLKILVLSSNMGDSCHFSKRKARVEQRRDWEVRRSKRGSRPRHRGPARRALAAAAIPEPLARHPKPCGVWAA